MYLRNSERDPRKLQILRLVAWATSAVALTSCGARERTIQSAKAELTRDCSADFESDRNHCGVCGNVCAPNYDCESHQCTPGSQACGSVGVWPQMATFSFSTPAADACTNIAPNAVSFDAYGYWPGEEPPKAASLCNEAWNGGNLSYTAWWRTDLGGLRSIRAIAMAPGVYCGGSRTPLETDIHDVVRGSIDGQNYFPIINIDAHVRNGETYIFDFGRNVTTRHLRIDTNHGCTWTSFKLAIFDCRYSLPGIAGPELRGINIDPANTLARPPPLPDELLLLGAPRVRVEFKAPNGVDNAFGMYDQWIDDYSARGISTLLLIDYLTLPGFRCGSPDFLSNYVPQFITRLRQVASHYQARSSNIAAYEIWNEEDFPGQPDGYCPFVDRHQYAQLLAQAANAVRVAAPGTPIVMGGLGGSDGTYLADVIVDMGSDWARIDAVGIHPYGFWPSDTGDHGRPSMPAALAATGTSGKPLWLTEHGDEDLSTQAEYVSTFFSYFDGHPGLIDQAFLFGWSDAMRQGHPFGVYNSSGDHKPTWDAFHAAAFPP